MPAAADVPGYRRGPHRVALFATAVTWPLLFVGGLVTTYRVGMAVPDWPTTFGINMFLYDFTNATNGVFIEHGHRLYGAAVGLATVILAAWFFVADRRPWMKAMGIAALLAVIGQGVLGGYRVRMNSTNLAAVHGCTAQAFFALMTALCVLTGRPWTAAPRPRADPSHLRRRSAVTLGLIYGQVVAGAWLRHFSSPLALYLHAILAAAVWGHAAMLSWRVVRHRADVPALVPSAWAMASAVTFQVALGVAAWWMLRPFDGVARAVSAPQALIRTGHLANGGLLLASAVILTLRAFRALLSPAILLHPETSTARTLEAVA